MPRAARTIEKLAPVHPGEVLLHEFLEPLGLSQYRVAHDLSVPPRRINEIVHGRRAVTADTDLRLARYFGLSEGFFLGLQAEHDLMAQRRRLRGGAEGDHAAGGLSGRCMPGCAAGPAPW